MSYQFHRTDFEKSGLNCMEFLFRNTDIAIQIQKFNKFKTQFIRRPIENICLSTLRKDIEEKFSTFGWFGFSANNFFEAAPEVRSESYGGLGITFNPYNWQGVENPHVHVLGDRRYNLGTLFSGKRGREIWDDMVLTGTKKRFYELVGTEGLRVACEFLVEKKVIDLNEIQDSPYDERAQKQTGVHTYSDTLSFNRLTPAAKEGYLAQCLSRVKRTLVRSRLVELKSDSAAEVHWHTDEILFFCTRVNLPIWSNVKQELLTETSRHTLDVGAYYSWDTSLPHKIQVEGVGSRTNLVLGICPWFDFDEESEVWSSNNFYGQLHPQEMIEAGLLVGF